MNELRRILKLAVEGNYDRAVLVTLLKTEGSSYRRPGAKLLITDHGESAGSISGGCLETEVSRQAAAALSGNGPSRSIIDTTGEDDGIFGSGSGCPGRLHLLIEPFRRDAVPFHLRALHDAAISRRRVVIATTVFGEVRRRLLQSEEDTSSLGDEVFVEVVDPPKRLFVFGAGNDAIPLARMADDVGYEVIVVDHRESVLTHSRFPAAARLIAARPETLPRDLGIDEHSAAVVTTHNYAIDRAYTDWLLGTEIPYIAIIGSRSRGDRLRRDVGARDGLERIFTPAGLDIGSETPAEIALAVLAEAKAVLARRCSGHLSRRRIGAVLLAAGRSRRLGRAKQLLEYEGEPLIRRSARAILDAGIDQVCVVLGADADRVTAALEGLPVQTVTNHSWRSGVGSSIAAGVRQLLSSDPALDGILIALCDQPRVQSQHFAALRDAFINGAAPMVAASYAGTAGAPAVFAPSKFDALLKLQADQGAKRLLRDSSDRTLLVPMPEAELDVDTPEDEGVLRAAP